MPNPINPPSGCRFHPRCPRFQAETCDTVEPLLRERENGHSTACFFPLERWPLTPEEMATVDGARVDGVRAELSREPDEAVVATT